jgi:hypothetical protein
VPRLGLAAVTATVLVSTPGCATLLGCRGFELSLASDRGGQPTPVAAAEWFAEHGDVGGVPGSGWRRTGQDQTGVVLRSGSVTLHASQGSDGTWQVVSGTTC